MIGSIFGSQNSEEIDKLNQNILKNNKNIKITNERIDILAKNISRVQETVTEILDKLVSAQETADIHFAILWNLDQLAASISEIKNNFKFGELTLTLLEEEILNAELVDLKSFELIIQEGLKAFPKLRFPLQLTRYQLPHIIKIITIKRVGHLKFLMVIPLTQHEEYQVFSLIPHPIKISETSLALPELKEIILKNKDQSYIIANKENLYSISAQHHLLLEMEPIYAQTKDTCEWAAFESKTEEMLALCNFHKIGLVGDVFSIEANNFRIVYFTNRTQVELDCPETKVKDSLIGLHKLPLSCNIKTDQVFFPAKQTLTVEIAEPETNPVDLDSTQLPTIELNKTSKIHTSLRELLDKLPKPKDKYTIDFDYYGLTLQEIQTYTIYYQTTLTVIVIINSILIGFLFVKWILRNRTQLKKLSHQFRDSVRTRRDQLNRDSFRKFRGSIRSIGSSIRRRIQNKLPSKPRFELEEVAQTRDAMTNTETRSPPSYSPEIYPALPRYT